MAEIIHDDYDEGCDQRYVKVRHEGVVYILDHCYWYRKDDDGQGVTSLDQSEVPLEVRACV